MSQLLENIHKTENIILENNSNVQNLQQEEKENIVNLWNSQVDQLKSAILAACGKKLDDDDEKISSSSSTIIDFAKSHNIKLAMIFDIEGTITPLFFVTKILFPFFIDKCESFVKKNLTEKVLKLARSTHNKSGEEQDLLTSLEKSMVEVASEFIKYFYRSESKSSTETSTTREENEDVDDLETFQNKLIQDSLEHTRANRKIPYMKKLQGICWHQAYIDGSIAGDLFTDIVPFLEQFSSVSKTTTNELHIYSSGSVFAQKLLLGHSRFGDLAQKFFHGYHDTVTAGMKFEAESYKKIYESISTQTTTTTTNANEQQQNDKVVCVFFSDSMLELRAAQQASATSSDVTFVPVFTIRPQNPKVDCTTTSSENTVEFPSIFTFAQVSEALGLVTAAVCERDEKSTSKFESIEKELKQIRDDVKKYSVTENEERKVF